MDWFHNRKFTQEILKTTKQILYDKFVTGNIIKNDSAIIIQSKGKDIKITKWRGKNKIIEKEEKEHLYWRRNDNILR